MSAYKQQKHTKQMNENGLTLVEVLASVVLLTIIITIFLNVFIQSAKTNTTSEEVVDATYIAQTEMERIYSVSLNSSYDMTVDTIVDPEELNYTQKHDSSCNVTERCMIFYKDEQGYYIEVKLEKKDLDESDEILEFMDHLIIKVYEGSTAEKKPQAQMENILVWEADSE